MQFHKIILFVAFFGAFVKSTIFASNASIQGNKFKLITSLYNETNVDRIREYVRCLETNLKHELIDEIHIIYDSSAGTEKNIVLDYLKTKSVTLHYKEGRPDFGYCFKLANSFPVGSKVIISNADIYFNETLLLLKNYNLKNMFLALSRWNVKSDGSIEIFKIYDKHGNFLERSSHFSQDVWIFETPIRKFVRDDFQLGVYTCDSAIAYQAWQAGLKLLNPCYSIQCCHLHLSNIRHYEIKQLPNTQFKIVPWCYL